MEIKDLAKKYKDYVINLRREFHQILEPSMEEYETSKKIKEELKKLEIKYKEVRKTGVVATIDGKNQNKKIALRADMDALQVKECTRVEYSSKNCGMMHACGHNGHISMLLGAAKILNEIKE